MSKFIFHRSVAAPLFILSHGHTVAKWPESDPLVDLAEKVVEEFSEAIQPGRYMVDLFPIRKN